MNSRILGIDQRSAELRLLLEEEPDLAADFTRRYEISRLVHDNALDGLVLSEEEIEGVFGAPIRAEGSSLTAIKVARNHRETMGLLEEEVQAKRKLSQPFLVSLYEILLRETHANAKLLAIYRKDIPLHRSYFHPIVDPKEVDAEFAAWFGSLEDAEFLEQHPIKRAAIAHWEFMRVFPFAEHNGRIGRLIQTYYLLDAGYLPAIIHANDRQRYYEALGKSPTALREVLMDAMDYCLDNSVRSLEALREGRAASRSSAR